MQEHLPRLRRFGVPVFVSIMAPGVPGFRKIARYLQREAGDQLAGLEVYITAPNSGAGADITARHVREATEAVRNEPARRRGRDSEAAAVARPHPGPGPGRPGGRRHGTGRHQHPESAAPAGRPQRRAAGGWAVGRGAAALALRCVWELAHDEQLHLPIFGTGGIFTLRDVEDYLRVGAHAVQVASGEWLSPGLSARLASEVALKSSVAR
ncbi:hypothetical protein ACFQT0_09160 [Hymenobacter humi]|uniref:Dihydroorotate dehydrogenase catalytic domain-containing protein n=1 Tax=Hymenobacter humi TaxID=1411620 RepID=A0ABW2U594_9BACT